MIYRPGWLYRPWSDLRVTDLVIVARCWMSSSSMVSFGEGTGSGMSAKEEADGKIHRGSQKCRWVSVEPQSQENNNLIKTLFGSA